jgi:hypothetical protein
MKMKFEMVPVDKLYLGNEINPVKLTDVADTVSSSLSDKENIIYMKANMKVFMGKQLSRDEVMLYDRIDALTMEKYGLCLKDSKVTKARIKASIKYGIKFNDRDGLISHMKSFSNIPFVNKELI